MLVSSFGRYGREYGLASVYERRWTVEQGDVFEDKKIFVC